MKDDPMRRALLDDLALYATVEELVAEGQFDEAVALRARALGWKAPPSNRELEAMAKAYASGAL